MTAYACDHCKHSFVADEPRCPKCLRKSSVREDRGAVSEVAALAASDREPDARPGLLLALLGLSLTISLALLAVYLSFDRTLGVLRGEIPAAVGLAAGTVVSLGFAPRFAVHSDRPMPVYLAWLAVAAATGTSIAIVGILATWMLADSSVVLAAIVAVVMWLACAIPAFDSVRRMLAQRERGGTPRAVGGKWR